MSEYIHEIVLQENTVISLQLSLIRIKLSGI